uniref:Uncharacterized protein n=1 Tax=Poecilia latipinna TaxID=48699 RepID=A0A3B3V6T1_9TELE
MTDTQRERQVEKKRERGREKQGWLNNETNTCIHVIGPAARLGAAAGGRGAARVKHIVHRALHLTVVDGLTLVGAERDGDEHDYTLLSKSMTHSATRGPARPRSTPLKSRSSPGNSSGLRERREKHVCIVSAARLLDAKTPNMDEVSGTFETTAVEEETADRLLFFFCCNPIW